MSREVRLKESGLSSAGMYYTRYTVKNGGMTHTMI